MFNFDEKNLIKTMIVLSFVAFIDFSHSDANAYYHTDTYSTSYTSGSNWVDYTLTLPKFDTNLGTIVTATLYVKNSALGYVTIQNNSPDTEIGVQHIQGQSYMTYSVPGLIGTKTLTASSSELGSSASLPEGSGANGYNAAGYWQFVDPDYVERGIPAAVLWDSRLYYADNGNGGLESYMADTTTPWSVNNSQWKAAGGGTVSLKSSASATASNTIDIPFTATAVNNKTIFYEVSYTYTNNTVPEPSTYILLGISLGCVGFVRYRMTKQAPPPQTA